MRDGTERWKSFTSIAGVAVGLACIVVACGGSNEASVPSSGREIYVASCQTCHGRQGEGFVGPSLLDIAARYPDTADQIALVTSGRGEMPAFGGRLTTKQIATVVDYTRVAFASDAGTSSTTAPPIGPTVPTTTAP